VALREGDFVAEVVSPLEANDRASPPTPRSAFGLTPYIERAIFTYIYIHMYPGAVSCAAAANVRAFNYGPMGIYI